MPLVRQPHLFARSQSGNLSNLQSAQLSRLYPKTQGCAETTCACSPFAISQGLSQREVKMCSIGGYEFVAGPQVLIRVIEIQQNLTTTLRVFDCFFDLRRFVCCSDWQTQVAGSDYF
jgi:hypothetical protein